jgi:secondary thiamine-phosphate synthase enzyme
MPVHTDELVIDTPGRSLVDVTERVARVVKDSRIAVGLCNVFIRHTSASLIICENADPDVRRDLERFLSDLVRDGDPRFVHTAEGPDDMPSHVRSVLTATSVSMPVRDGSLSLGTWQGLYLWEHRHRAHRRKLDVTILG